ncbi:MAG: hypothetical protein HGA47_12020 [Zoogloea sp.]|nr:hypothetical protein [Zoogloea sp.]
MRKQSMWRMTRLVAALGGIGWAAVAVAGAEGACQSAASWTADSGIFAEPSALDEAPAGGDGLSLAERKDDAAWAEPYLLWHREVAGDGAAMAALFEEARPAADAMFVLGPGKATSLAALDGMRGGFTGVDGLQISFGIERAVRINGELVTSTILSLPNAGALSAAQAAAVPGVPTIVQNGAGNLVLPGASGLAQNGYPLVIQNTLDNQRIEAATVVNASVNSLQMMRAIDFSNTIRDSVLAATRR